MLRRYLHGVLPLLFLAAIGHGQQCPMQSSTGADIPSITQVLRGQLIFHDALRKWFELKLDAPHCGQESVQLVTVNSSAPIETFRGCRVASNGPLEDAGTGYLSLPIYQDAQHLATIGACERKPPLPDYSHLRPVSWVRQYRVTMALYYGPGDHPIHFQVSTKGRPLSPWQAYASYDLTGSFALYGHCGKGFVVDRVFGPSRAKPQHFDEPRTPSDSAAFDPESAAAVGLRNLKLGYTCVRGE